MNKNNADELKTKLNYILAEHIMVERIEDLN